MSGRAGSPAEKWERHGSFDALLGRAAPRRGSPWCASNPETGRGGAEWPRDSLRGIPEAASTLRAIVFILSGDFPKSCLHTHDPETNGPFDTYRPLRVLVLGWDC